MKIYTRTGDEGEAGLIGGRRSKDNIRIEAYGTVDELNSFVQLAISKMPEDMAETRESFMKISGWLFDCGGALADIRKEKISRVTNEMVDELEKMIDDINSKLEPVKGFILPGGCEASASIHVCRAVARRAERRIVELSKAEETDAVLLKFINRLSDYLFTAARWANKVCGAEQPWK